MTGTSPTRIPFHLLRRAGTVAFGFLMLPLAQAQRPVLNAAATHTSVRPIVAQLSPEPSAPEPPQAAQSTPPLKDDLFAGTEKFAKGASDVTEVTMDPNSLDLVGGPDAKRAHRMILNVVRTYTYDKPGMFNPADVEEYRRKLESGDWHCSVHIRDLKNGDSTDVCSRNRPPDMVENAIITVSPKSLTFIHNIRKANGQGGGLDTGGFPGVSMILPEVPMQLSLQAMQPVIAAEMMASTAALRAQMPVFTQNFKFDMPENMAAMSQQMKNFHFDMKPIPPDQFKQMEKQLRESLRNMPSPEQMQQIQNQLKDLQKDFPQQP